MLLRHDLLFTAVYKTEEAACLVYVQEAWRKGSGCATGGRVYAAKDIASGAWERWPRGDLTGDLKALTCEGHKDPSVCFQKDFDGSVDAQKPYNTVNSLTLAQCYQNCRDGTWASCAGFSRYKSVADSALGDCWWVTSTSSLLDTDHNNNEHMYRKTACSTHTSVAALQQTVKSTMVLSQGVTFSGLVAADYNRNGSVVKLIYEQGWALSVGLATIKGASVSFTAGTKITSSDAVVSRFDPAHLSVP